MDDVNSIFQDYLASNADQEFIDFSPLLEKHPELRESLQRKIKAYQKVIGVLQDEPAEEKSASLVGQEIGGCKLLRLLGQGGMGVVYLGHQEKLRRDVVVKVLRPFAVDNQALKERFLRESRIIGRLNHKNIVPIYDVGEERGSFYIIMKYLEGVPLSVLIQKLANTDRSSLKIKDIMDLMGFSVLQDKLKDFRTPTEFFCSLIIRIAEAIQYTHDNGVIHRDVKPSNIIVEPDGNPVLLDFGLSHDEIEQNLTLSGEFLGTPVYSAPELFAKGTTKHNRLLDVYSLGVTLYELMTGGLPYEGDSIYEIYANIKNREPVRPKTRWNGIPRDLETIISTAIAKAPEFRYQAIGTFREDLECLLNYRPIQAKAPSSAMRLLFFARRRKRALISFGIILLLIGGSIGAYYYKRYRSLQLLITDATLELRSGYSEQLINKLQNATASFPDRAELWFFLGTTQMSAGHYSQAAESIKKAIHINDQPIYHSTLAGAYLYLGDLIESNNEIEKTLSATPSDTFALYLRGTIRILQNRLHSAAEDLIQIKKVDPSLSSMKSDDMVGVSTGLSLIYEELGFHNLARKTILDAILGEPFYQPQYHLAKRLHWKKEMQKRLESTIEILGNEKLQFRDNPLILSIPGAWSRRSKTIFGNDVIAEYKRTPLRARDMYIQPTLLVAHLKKQNGLLEDTFRFMDRLVVRYEGATDFRYVEKVKNHPYTKYMVLSDVSLPLEKIKTMSIVMEYGDSLYLIACYASKESLALIINEMTSLFASASINPEMSQPLFSPPNGLYSVEMPSPPIYRVTRGADEQFGQVHMLSTDPDGLMSIEHSVFDIPLASPVDDKTLEAGYQRIRNGLKTSWKISHEEKTVDKSGTSYFIFLTRGSRQAIFKIFSVENHLFGLAVSQEANINDKTLADSFFASFQFMGEASVKRLPQLIPNLQELKITNERQLEEYQILAATGDPVAQNELGKYYLFRNHSLALSLFEKAAEAGNVRAINNIGLMYERGMGVEKSLPKAVEFYRRAADQGLDIAQANLGIALSGQTSERDHVEALKWLKMAASQGESRSAYQLGMIYEFGISGVTPDWREADLWYRQMLSKMSD